MVTFELTQKTALSVAFDVTIRGGSGGEPKDRLLKDNVTVDPIAVARVENPSGGKTIFIGGIFNG